MLILRKKRKEISLLEMVFPNFQEYFIGKTQCDPDFLSYLNKCFVLFLFLRTLYLPLLTVLYVRIDQRD